MGPVPGLDQRFVNELADLAPTSMRPALVKPPEYMPENTLKYSSWTGGAILAKVNIYVRHVKSHTHPVNSHSSMDGT
jgi:actin-related protein